MWTILASVNLLAALLGYSFLAYALARLRWRGRGVGLVLLAIVICGEIWLIPKVISARVLGWNTLLYPLWFGDWLGSVFSIVLFCHTLGDASRNLEDAARLDGCGPLRIYWHIVLPLARPTLLLITVFIFMATWSVFLAPLLSLPNPYFPAVSQLQPGQQAGPTLWVLLLASLLTTLPVIAIFFLARRHFRTPSGWDEITVARRRG
jgi:multiple sugar transport system permease protein